MTESDDVVDEFDDEARLLSSNLFTTDLKTHIVVSENTASEEMSTL